MRIIGNHFAILFAILLAGGLQNLPAAHASEDASAGQLTDLEKRLGNIYRADENVMSSVAGLRDAALQNNKLMLVVMGANWCHDSRALATRLNKEPLKTLVNAHYETLFVDVGFLDSGQDVITSFGIPVYYATPSVLIVDPVSGRLVNARNRHQWGDAGKISMEESVDYFQQMSNTDLEKLRTDAAPDPELQRLNAEIDRFEQTQAERLYAAYAILGPMLEADARGDSDQFSYDHWNQVSDFRSKVPLDIDRLRDEARTRVAAGEQNIVLEYPEYPAFSWESKKR